MPYTMMTGPTTDCGVAGLQIGMFLMLINHFSVRQVLKNPLLQATTKLQEWIHLLPAT